VAEGRIKALVVLGEDPTEFGITVEQLKKLPSFITMNILRNAATAHATAILPSAAYAEKRGSMINGRGRLQRLNRAVRPPGQAREDWEILRDLLQEFTGSNGLGSIEDVFRQMAESLPPLAGLSLSKIGDLGVKVMATPESSATPSPPGEPSDEEFFERPPLHAVK
jgi:NADH-quinone oxidoreductase subunit G